MPDCRTALRSRNASASSISLAWTRLSTGPKISVSVSSLVAGTASRTVGFTKFPASCFGMRELRPSSRTFAPCFSPVAINDSTRDLLCGVITGPICTPSSRPLPTRSDAAASVIESRKVFCASPTVTATETARQRCPAQPKALSPMICVVIFMSASGNTMTWFFAPPWHCARLPLLAGARIDVSRHRRGTDKTDGAHLGMIEQRVDRGLAAIHQIHHALGQSDVAPSAQTPASW